MTRRLGAALALAVLAVGVAALVVGVRRARGASPGRTRSIDASPRGRGEPPAALADVRFYGSVLMGDAVRRAERAADGAIRVDLDLSALLRPRLADRGLDALTEGLPRRATGVIRLAGRGIAGEEWRLDGEAPLLQILDRQPDDRRLSRAWAAIPGDPTAIAAWRLQPERLADSEFGGAPLADWRARADIAERVLGRPLRAELAEDLGRLAVFALYDAPPGREPGGLLAVELKRTDRLRSLLDTMFALATLTQRATIQRYRDVPIGYLRASPSAPGWGIAIDGEVLLISRSSQLLETAIDARRRPGADRPLVAAARAMRSSWTAVSESAFVAHAWSRIARERPLQEGTPAPRVASRLLAEGTASWRLIGVGPEPVVTADPVVPFLRSVMAAGQGAGD
jgi:hypothetical protein